MTSHNNPDVTEKFSLFLRLEKTLSKQLAKTLQEAQKASQDALSRFSDPEKARETYDDSLKPLKQVKALRGDLFAADFLNSMASSYNWPFSKGRHYSGVGCEQRHSEDEGVGASSSTSAYYCGNFHDGTPNGLGVQNYESIFRSSLSGGSNKKTLSGIWEAGWRVLGISKGTSSRTRVDPKTWDSPTVIGQLRLVSKGWLSVDGKGDQYVLDGLGSWCEEGGTLIGEFSNGYLSGFGIVKFQDGDSFKSIWADGVPNGPGCYKWADGNELWGEWSEGRLDEHIVLDSNGRRVFSTSAGHVWPFEGCLDFGRSDHTPIPHRIYRVGMTDFSVEGGVFNGELEFREVVINRETHTEERREEGRWRWSRDEVLERFGTQLKMYRGVFNAANGDQFEGSFRNSKLDGYGRASYRDGLTYVGDFIGGKRTGKGLQFFKDGGSYSGDFLDDRRHGRGEAIYSNGDRYSGQWVNDCRTGFGELVVNDGTHYIGGWIESKRFGYGVMTFTDGSKLSGNYIEDRLEGLAIFTSPLGKSERQYWQAGVRDESRVAALSWVFRKFRASISNALHPDVDNRHRFFSSESSYVLELFEKFALQNPGKNFYEELSNEERNRINELLVIGEPDEAKSYLHSLYFKSNVEVTADFLRVTLGFVVKAIPKYIFLLPARQLIEEVVKIPASVLELIFIFSNKFIGGDNDERRLTSIVTNPLTNAATFLIVFPKGIAMGTLRMISTLWEGIIGDSFEHPLFIRNRKPVGRIWEFVERINHYGWRVQAGLEAFYSELAYQRSIFNSKILRKSEVKKKTNRYINIFTASDYLTVSDMWIADAQASASVFQDENGLANEYYRALSYLSPTQRSAALSVIRFIKVPANTVDFLLELTGIWGIAKLVLREREAESRNFSTIFKGWLNSSYERAELSKSISYGIIFVVALTMLLAQ